MMKTNLNRRAALLFAALCPAIFVGGAAPAKAPGVAPIDINGLKQQIAARKGKVVVVNYWATWCGPCVSEFPSLVKLYNANKTKGMELITISCDEARDTGKANAFLAKNGLQTGTFINKKAVEISDHLKFLEPKLADDDAVSIPRTYIFDRNGKLVKAIDKEQSLAQFQAAIAPYLAKK